MYVCTYDCKKAEQRLVVGRSLFDQVLGGCSIGFDVLQITKRKKETSVSPQSRSSRFRVMRGGLLMKQGNLPVKPPHRHLVARCLLCEALGPSGNGCSTTAARLFAPFFTNSSNRITIQSPLLTTFRHDSRAIIRTPGSCGKRFCCCTNSSLSRPVAAVVRSAIATRW